MKPLFQTGQNDGEYLAAFLQVVLPIATAFDPELVLVSAGFDAGVGDPLGKCCVTPEMFGHMTHLLKNLAGGKMIMLLEGGYNFTTVSHSVMMCAKALLGDPLPSITSPWLQNDGSQKIIDSVIDTHAKKWAGLKLPDFKTRPSKHKITTPTALPVHGPQPAPPKLIKIHRPLVSHLTRRENVLSDCREPSVSGYAYLYYNRE